MTRIAVRLPNHLGDTVMSWPALHALATVGSLTLYGPDLLRPYWPHGPWEPARTMPRGAHDVAVLLAPSLRAAWEARRVRRRIGTPSDARRWLLTDVVPPRRHRADTYAALALRLGAVAVGPPRLSPSLGRGAPDHVGLNPVVKGGENRAWPHFRALADALAAHAPVRFYAGPGEDAPCAAVAGPHPRSTGQPLAAFAQSLASCGVFVSNDAGAAHFAAALGVPVVVVYGPTAPDRTGPAGARRVVGFRPACAPCYRNRCSLPRQRCHDAPVAAVVAEVEELWGT